MRVSFFGNHLLKINIVWLAKYFQETDNNFANHFHLETFFPERKVFQVCQCLVVFHK